MGTIKNAVYKVDNGTDFDEIHFKTKASQVFCNDGKTVESQLAEMINEANKTQNGWWKDKKTGLIIQWGNCRGTSAVTFPITFPNACLQVFIDGQLSTDSSPIYHTLSCAFGFNKSNFTVVSYGYIELGVPGTAQANFMYKNIVGSASFNGNSRWLAIGY